MTSTETTLRRPDGGPDAISTPVGARRRRVRPPAYLLVPAGLAACLAILPLAYLTLRGLGAGQRAVGRLFSSSTAEILANTAVLATIVTTACLAVGTLLAWLVTRTDLPARRLWTVLLVLPLVVPSYVAAYAYIGAFGVGGMLDSAVGWTPRIHGLPGAATVLALVSYPYVLLTVRGALLGMDPAIEDASRSLGHGLVTTFRRVTLPLLRPAMGAGALLVALYTLSDFGVVSLLRFDSFTRAIFLSYRAGFDRTGAVVLALALVAFAAVLLVVEARLRGKASGNRTGVGTQRQPTIVPLGRWKWPALAVCTLVVAASLAVPLGVLGYWLVRGVVAGEPLRLFAETWLAAWHSLRASVLAAVAATVLAVPIAVLSVRFRRPSTVLLERATYVGYALPGIVVALALVFFGARYGGPLYQTLALMVVAYVILFLPQAIGATRASMLLVPPSIEEAARGLGQPGWRVLLRVTAPMVRPGIVAGAVLVFLTAMKELPATLLLGPTGERTLATAIWSASSEAFFARAAAPALLLVLIAGIPMGFLLYRRQLGGMS